MRGLVCGESKGEYWREVVKVKESKSGQKIKRRTNKCDYPVGGTNVLQDISASILICFVNVTLYVVITLIT